MDRTMERLINLREQLAVSAGDGSLRCWRMWIKLGDPDLMAGCAAEAAHDGLAAYAIDDALQELSVLRAKLEQAEQENKTTAMIIASYDPWTGLDADDRDCHCYFCAGLYKHADHCIWLKSNRIAFPITFAAAPQKG